MSTHASQELTGLILWAGPATRLRPLTYTGAKHLLPIGGKPVVEYGIERMKHAGIHEIGMVVGKYLPEFEEALGTGSRHGVNLNYIVQTKARGLAHAVVVSQEYLGESPFLMYLGDNLIKSDLSQYAKRFLDEKLDALILLAKVQDPRAFGVAILKEGRVVGVEEKPAKPTSNLAITGIYFFSPVIHDAIARLKPSARGELEITDAIGLLIAQGAKVYGEVITGWWKDTGKPTDILAANRLILEDLEQEILGEVDEASHIDGRVFVAPGAVVRDSHIRGPVFIGPGAMVVNSFLGPFTSLSAGVRIVGSELENTVVMDNCLIENVGARIDQSIIGRGATIRASVGKPQSHRFVVSDSSQIEVL